MKNPYADIHRSIDESITEARRRPMAVRLDLPPAPEPLSGRWILAGFALSAAIWGTIIALLYWLL